jgi:hypothetical protein
MEEGRRLFVLKESAENVSPSNAPTPTINALYDALRAADATGDVSTAKKLAAQIRITLATNHTAQVATEIQDNSAANLQLVHPNQSAASKTFTMTGADGKNYTIEGPAGSTKEQAVAVMQKSLDFTCDPEELATNNLRQGAKVLRAGPSQVLAAYTSKSDALGREVGYALALILLGIGSVPALWYFSLRRLGEIADAVRGK